jgi:hypothetical protein
MVSENGTALDAYELARNLLVKRGVARETIDEVFSPAIPPSIPVLPASIVGTIGDHSLRGYIDAAVQLTRFGDVKDVEILDESAGTSRAVAKGFRHYLAWQAFRPRFVAGELARSDRFSARFYYAY